ncbi:hypothetical protein Tco_0037074, partial [Tanacetum coccineum]
MHSKEIGTPRYLSLVVPLRKVGDEVIHKELGDIMERVATTASSSEAKQDNDAQTRFETTSKQSNDPPLSKVNTFGSAEDSMQLMELMTHCTKLSTLLQLNAAKLKHQLVLPVQVLAAEGDSINTSIKGFTYFFIRFHSFKHYPTIRPNSISSVIIKIMIMLSPKFAETYNVVAFFKKPTESDEFAEIIDFL